MSEIQIYTEFITLGQFLKLSGVINNGGEAKLYLKTELVVVNGAPENRRGRKLYKGDLIQIKNKKYVITKKNEDKIN